MPDLRCRSASSHAATDAQRIVGEPDADPRNVPEPVVHEIWRLQQFRSDDLTTTDGQRLVILEPGQLNDHQGPDFLDARLVLGSTTWVGAVEIHLVSSDWFRHRHHMDPLYEAVILHVTLVADKNTGQLARADGSIIPEMVLYPRLNEPLRTIQWRFKKGGRMFFACEDHWTTVPDSVLAPFLERLGRDRLRRKALRLGERFLAVPDLNQLVYEETFRSLGYAQNGEAMVLLGRRVPFRMLEMISDPRDAAALLLGSAGLIAKTSKKRSAFDQNGDLGRRFEELSAAGAPTPLPATIWRAARLRPANSPGRRILQAAALFVPSGPLGGNPIEKVAALHVAHNPRAALKTLLEISSDVSAYMTGDPRRSLSLGTDRRVTIAANAWLPVLQLHAEQHGSAFHETRALSILRELPVIMDSVIRPYSSERGRPTSTMIAQGLHELSRSMCGRGRCRECPIWQHIAGRFDESPTNKRKSTRG